MSNGYDLSKYIYGESALSVSEINEKYKDSPIVLMALSEMYPPEAMKPGTPIQLINKDQEQYINALYENKLSTKEIRENLNIPAALVTVWTRGNKLFAKCIEIIKETQADQAEEILWNNAIDPESKDSISRMFALKARKQEYRDNATPQINTAISLKITLDDKDIDTAAGFKIVGED